MDRSNMAPNIADLVLIDLSFNVIIYMVPIVNCYVIVVKSSLSLIWPFNWYRIMIGLRLDTD